MKLCRVRNKVVGDVVYYKWLVTLPPGAIEDLGWGTSTVLDYAVGDDELVLVAE